MCGSGFRGLKLRVGRSAKNFFDNFFHGVSRICECTIRNHR